MRPRRTISVLTVLLLTLGLMAGPVSASGDLPRDDDGVLDSDDTTTDVACPTDMENVDGVSGVVLDSPGGDVYVAPWEFDGTAHGGLESFEWTADSEPYHSGDIDSPGADGNWYPPYPSEHDNHTIVYSFNDGTEWTASADFEGGCITEDGVSWDVDAAEPNVEVQFTDNVETDLDVGESGTYEVNVTNDGAAFENGWQLALEVEGDELSTDDVDLTWVTDGGGQDFDFDIEDGILYVYGEHEDEQLVYGYDENQEFEVTFNKSGTFTGTVYVMDTGEAFGN